MSAFYFAKFIHLLGASVLLGSGLAIAFFMLMAWRSGNRRAFAQTARHVVLADFLFTASAVVIQPVSGAALVVLSGQSFAQPWLLASIGLYLFVGACWLPVVWIQLAVRRRLEQAGEAAEIDRLMRIWFLLGWPAFAGVLAIFALMVTRPVFS